VVLDRNRGGAYLSMFIASAGLFGIFLFLTYYLQQTLGYSPLVTGVAFLPMSAGLILAANLATIVLMPRTGPRPLVALGMLAAAGGGRRGWPSWARTPPMPGVCSARSSWPVSAWAW
jgi:Na+/melibiose symporter-like transporter